MNTDQKSISGFFFLLGGSPKSWQANPGLGRGHRAAGETNLEAILNTMKDL